MRDGERLWAVMSHNDQLHVTVDAVGATARDLGL